MGGEHRDEHMKNTNITYGNIINLCRHIYLKIH